MAQVHDEITTRGRLALASDDELEHIAELRRMAWDYAAWREVRDLLDLRAWQRACRDLPAQRTGEAA